MEISFKKLCTFLLKKWWIIAMALVIGAVGGFLLANSKTQTYRVSCQVNAKVVTGTVGPGDNVVDIINRGINNIIVSANDETFLETQIKDAGAGELLDKSKGKDVADYVTVSQATSSDFINIVCVTPKLDYSSAIVNNIIDNLNAKLNTVWTDGRYSIEKVSEPRVIEEDEDTSRIATTVIGGILIAVLAALVLVVIRVLDTRIYDEEEICERYNARFLGSIEGGEKK